MSTTTATAETVEQRVIKVIIKQADAPPHQVLPNARLIKDLGFDSLQVILLARELEEEFGLEEISGSDIDTFETVNDVLDYVSAWGGVRPPAF